MSGKEGEGFFLVFEGVEGAGKSTQAARLAARLSAAGIPHRVVREPGGTVVGERIRETVLDPELDPAPETELLLMLAARAEFVRRLVEPALERGEVVLADRYEMSTFAYQAMARGLGLERVRKLNRFATGGRKPDVTFLLDVDAEVGRRRVAGEGDRLERAGQGFHAAVTRAYRQLADTEPGVVPVDGGGEPATVEARIVAVLVDRWPERFGSLVGDPGDGVDPEAGRAGTRTGDG